jgi:hypothetical protein
MSEDATIISISSTETLDPTISWLAELPLYIHRPDSPTFNYTSFLDTDVEDFALDSEEDIVPEEAPEESLVPEVLEQDLEEDVVVAFYEYQYRVIDKPTPKYHQKLVWDHQYRVIDKPTAKYHKRLEGGTS